MSCPCKKAVNIFESASTPYRIGKTGENVYQEIEFNFSKWLSEYPGAKFDLLIKVPKNGYYLLAEGVTEATYIWKPTAFDLANPGHASVMARMSSGEVRAKSDPIPFEIVRAMDYNLDISEPGPTRPSLMDEWIEDIYEAAARYPKIGEDHYWYVWDVVEGDWIKTETSASGEIPQEELEQAINDYFNEHPVRDSNAVHYDESESLTSEEKEQARDNIGAGTYSKPSGGIPATDLEPNVIPTVPVQSVNGQTGAVVLDADDVGALPANTPIPPAVTEQTVAGWGFTKNTGTYSKPSGGIPKTDLASDVQTSLGKADTALQTAPVTSVNTKTGAVTLSASDVGALPSSTSIPTKVSDLTNDSGYQTAQDVQTAVEGVTPFEIPFTTTGLYDPWVFDSSVGVTSVDIFDAVYAKRPIVARVETNDTVEIIPANIAQADKDTEYRSAYLEFWTFGDSTSNESEYFFVNMSAEPDIGDPTAEITVDCNHRVKKTLPAVTASDNGKFLRVVNGAWAAETVQTWQGGSY